MATLTKNSTREYGVSNYSSNALPVIASDIIFEGAGIGEDASTGLARPLVIGDTFLGFAEAKADNSSGAAAAINVEVREQGHVKLNVAGVVGKGNIGETVFAADDDTFDLTSSGGGTGIGKVSRWHYGTVCDVWFQSNTVRSL